MKTGNKNKMNTGEIIWEVSNFFKNKVFSQCVKFIDLTLKNSSYL